MDLISIARLKKHYSTTTRSHAIIEPREYRLM
jgi:hypothetical protein